MIDCEFHETKRERKFYENKKLQALAVIDQMMQEYTNRIRTDLSSKLIAEIIVDLERIKEKVNDI